MKMLKRNLEYLRAQFISDEGQSLQELVTSAWGKLQTHDVRTVDAGEGRSIAGLKSSDLGQDGFRLHCAVYTEGQGVGTIAKPPAHEVDVGERPPGSDENFLNSDFMALIKGNHVICMGCGVGGARLRLYLHGLFDMAGISLPDSKFDLIRVVNPKKLAMIQSHKVKQIDFGGGFTEATFTSVTKATGIPAWQKLLNAIAESDKKLEQVRSKKHFMFNASVKLPRGSLEPTQELLTSVAENMASDEESEDAVTFHLGNNKILKPNEIVARKPVEVLPSANSVDVESVWNEMVEYIDELGKDGLLDI